MVEIFTTGFPRSGSTWLDRLLSDLLSAPLQSLPDSEMEEDFANEIKNDYIVRKTHWYRQEYSGKGYNEQLSKIILVSRDPRDMVVSMMHYRRNTDLQGTIRSIDNGVEIGKGFINFVNGWIDSQPDFWVTYEQLHTQPDLMLNEIHKVITGEPARRMNIKRVIEAQRFGRWKQSFTHSMRKGIVGDWKNFFKYDDALLMEQLYGDQLRILGYTTDPNWVDEVPD